MSVVPSKISRKKSTRRNSVPKQDMKTAKRSGDSQMKKVGSKKPILFKLSKSNMSRQKLKDDSTKPKKEKEDKDPTIENDKISDEVKSPMKNKDKEKEREREKPTDKEKKKKVEKVEKAEKKEEKNDEKKEEKKEEEKFEKPDEKEPLLVVPGEEKEKPKEARGKRAPPHFKTGLILNNRFKILRLLGGGGFGQVYKAADMNNQDRMVAVKVEPRDKEAGRMILEQEVLTKLRGTKHSPSLIASGMHENFLYLVMEILGRNLNDLRHRQSKRRFSAGTTLRICAQMTVAVQAVHQVGHLHRDVKPANMCIGLGEDQRRLVYLVDFGMTRKFTVNGGLRRKERSYAGFRGTIRYVSVTVHERREQGPCDDLWSLLYSMIEVGEGGLPWKHIEDDDDMAQKKKKTPMTEMLMYLPRTFRAYGTQLEALNYDSTPKYDELVGICTKNLPSDVTLESPFDWEVALINSNSGEHESE